ncbi:MAG TPA: sugar phosphate isomerase/epimerase family protein [Gaiellaceae bacterium]|nr:sugar phosphate isomerase/epimerase family protein [Gaiellaceae bacterium]
MAESNKKDASVHEGIMTDGADTAAPPPRAGVSQSTTAPWTLAEDARAYAQRGWDAIGIWLHKLERASMTEFWFPELRLTDETVAGAAAAVDAAGIAVSHVALAGRFTEADDTVRAERIEHAVHAADVAVRFGAACLVVVPGRLDGLAPARAQSMAAGALAEVLERAPGSRLAIEPVKEVDFATTLDEALDLVELVDHPRLGVFPDGFQLWRDPGIADALARAGDRVLGVHLADGTGAEGDRTRLPPGEGVLPLDAFVAAVEATGYAGTYDVELFSMGSTRDEAGALLDRCAAGLRTLLPAAAAAGA